MAYVGSKTNHIEITRNINTLPYQYLSTSKVRDNTWNNYLTATFSNPMYNLVPGNSQGTYTGTTISRTAMLVPYPAFGNNAINGQDNTGYSWYHSLQLSASKRFTKGYTLSASYTYAKWEQAVNLLNAADPAPVREVSDSDAPHRINISAVWSLPFGKGRKLLAGSGGVVDRIVGGWEVSGIWSLQSGFPLVFGNIIYYGDPASIVKPPDQRTPEAWFNNGAGFDYVSGDQLLGTQVRTFPRVFSTIRGPRQNNVDISLIKQTKLTETKNIEFRAEALNAANHPLFPNPNMTVTTAPNSKDTGFGQISASTMSNYARRLQLSIKFIF
jgi:hypothetical protein